MNSHTSALPKNFEVQSSSEDPIVKEVRDARYALAARLDNNLQKIGQDLMSRQQKSIHSSKTSRQSNEFSPPSSKAPEREPPALIFEGH